VHSIHSIMSHMWWLMMCSHLLRLLSPIVTGSGGTRPGLKIDKSAPTDKKLRRPGHVQGTWYVKFIGNKNFRGKKATRTLQSGRLTSLLDSPSYKQYSMSHCCSGQRTLQKMVPFLVYWHRFIMELSWWNCGMACFCLLHSIANIIIAYNSNFIKCTIPFLFVCAPFFIFIMLGSLWPLLQKHKQSQGCAEHHIPGPWKGPGLHFANSLLPLIILEHSETPHPKTVLLWNFAT
jgi:hypothetical protein